MHTSHVVRQATRMLALLTALCGCAGTKGSVTPLHVVSDDNRLQTFRNLELRETADAGVTISPADLDRIRDLIIARIHQEAPGRFAAINSASDAPSTLRATLRFTQYDAGDAAARLMLAGLGSIQIKATLQMTDAANDALLREYEITKTFAWGGIYGASTTIQDVEEGFADAVVAALVTED